MKKGVCGNMKKTIGKIIGFAASMLFLLCVLILPASAEAEVGAAGKRLDGNTQKIYLALRDQITAVANGTRESAKFTVDRDTMEEWGVKLDWSAAELGVGAIDETTALATLDLFWSQFADIEILTNALLHDLPFELYWYDKTEGNARTPVAGYHSETVSVTGMEFAYTVAKDYRPAVYDEEAPTVDTAKTAAAAEVMDTARGLVALYADRTDYEKLAAYRDEICTLVSYNDNAASNSYTGGYGDPWQLVYVFDGNPLTNVVCEGYAKAFQLLCELSTFMGEVACYTVSGEMGSSLSSERHMWNLVTMGDGCYYLVDVTNSDSGTSGAAGGLFLDGYDGTVANGFRLVTASSASLNYVYGSEDLALWGVEADSILYLHDADYEPPSIIFSIPTTLTYDGEAITVGETAGDIRYRLASSIVGDFDWTFVWSADGIPMPEAPKRAGSYLLRATATSVTDPLVIYEASIAVTVEQAMPDFNVPNNLKATYGDTLAEVFLTTGFAWMHPTDTAVGDAGARTFYLTYTPLDTDNYRTVTNIPVIITVKKATPTYTAPSALEATFGDTLAEVALPTGFAWMHPTDTAVGDVGGYICYLYYTPTDPANYEMITNIPVTLTVLPRDITGATVTLGANPIYNGTVLTQTVTGVTLDGKAVTFTVTGNTATEVGDYTLTVTGTGNYRGSVSARWRVLPASTGSAGGGEGDKAPTDGNSSTSTVGGANQPTTITVKADLPWGIIAAVGGGAVALVALIAVIILATRKKR